MSEWINIFDRKPKYGEPVLVVANGLVQNVTMVLDVNDHCEDWFEPYFFESGYSCKFHWDDATHWMPLPEPPK